MDSYDDGETAFLGVEPGTGEVAPVGGRMHPFRVLPGGMNVSGPTEAAAGGIIIAALVLTWLAGRSFKEARATHVHIGLYAGAIAFLEWVIAKGFWNLARDRLAGSPSGSLREAFGEAMSWWG